MSQMECNYCTLRLVAEKKVERCEQESCAFWESGGAVVRGACLIERLGIDVRRADLAAYLLDVRERLDRVRRLAGAEQGHREFSRRIGYEL